MSPNNPARLLAFVMLVLAAFTGCSHYQLGTEGKLSFKTLYIEHVGNDAGLPQAVALFSTHLRETFLRDGRVTLVNSPQAADATLEVNLSTLQRGIATTRTDDTGLARKLELHLTALCTLRDNRTGATLFERRPILASRQVFTTPTPAPADSDQLQAEYQTLPLLAANLAEKVVHSTLDVW